jgi:hypothetical protein
MEKNLSYFQFSKDLDVPVFVKCSLDRFDSNLADTLATCHFSRLNLSEKEIQDLELRVQATPHAKLLKIIEASPKVAAQIGSYNELDQFGAESLHSQSGYQVYRYKGNALMIHSSTSSEWELGVFSNFGHKEHGDVCRTIINRFLGWSLIPLGIVGFWGEVTKRGISILNQKESMGYAVYIDTNNQTIMSAQGSMVEKKSIQFVRIDQLRRKNTIMMSKEELISFLSSKMTFFDNRGLGSEILTLLRQIVKFSVGRITSNENTLPRNS